MIKQSLLIVSVLLVHTAAAQAQQSPVTADPADKAAQAFPPGYAPPPGYTPPAEAPPPAQPAPPPGQGQGYGPPPGQGQGYGPPPQYGPGPTYGPGYGPSYGQGYGPYPYGRPGRYAPPSYSYYPSQPPPRLITDRPFTLGGGIGFGGLIFDDPANNRHTSTQGMAYTLRLGFGLRPGLILMWDLEGTLVSNRDASTGASATAQTANFAALQIFATQRLFLKAGFGLAQVVQNDRPSAWGGAGMVGIGYELIQGWNWSLDLEATITGARYNNNGRDENWFNWSLVNFAINFF